jgi:chromate reductase
MASLTLLGICGSPRKRSTNHAVLRLIAGHLPVEVTYTEWDAVDELPIFNPDLPEPASVQALRTLIAAADGVIIASPEYNYSIPGGLKNALDWMSSPPASSPLRGKPIGIAGAASGMSGTMRAQNHLREILVFSDSPCMLQPEVLIPRSHERFDADGNLLDESTGQLLSRFATAFVGFVRKQRGS